MRLPSRRTAALIGAAAIAVSFAAPAFAESNVYCIEVQAIETKFPRLSTYDMAYCVPWPL